VVSKDEVDWRSMRHVILQVDNSNRVLVPHSFFPIAAGAVLTIAWTPDSHQVIAACETDDGSPRTSDVCIKICCIGGDADEQSISILSVEKQAGPLRAMCCSADGRYLYSIDTEQNLVCHLISWPHPMYSAYHFCYVPAFHWLGFV